MMPQTSLQYRQKTSWILPLFYFLSSLFSPRFVCKTTGANYRAEPANTWTVSGRTFAQVRCPLCDADMRARDHPLYDPSNPQVHFYEMN